MNTLRLTAGALCAWGALSGAALAAESTVALHVRSGPGTGYGVVDTLFAGEQVKVNECRSNGWCYITHSGPDGWASARYLDRTSIPRQVSTRTAPNVTLSFSFGRAYGRSIQRPGRGGTRDLVCLVTFYHRSQVAGGRDADVQRARTLPRQQAERLDTPSDRQAIYDYGTDRQTRDTCRYLDRLNR